MRSFLTMVAVPFTVLTSWSICSAWADGIAIEATKITAELGVSILGELSTETDFTIPASTLPVTDRSDKLESLLQDYVKLRNGYTSAKAGSDRLSSITTGITAAGGIVGSVPMVIVGGVLRGTVEYGRRSLDANAMNRTRNYLVGIGDVIVEHSRAEDFVALVDNPEIIKETLINSSYFLSDVKQRAQKSGDTALVATVAASVAQVADAKAVNAYKQAESNAAEFARLDRDFSEFSNHVDQELKVANARIKENENRLSNLEDDVRDLGIAVEDMQTQIVELGRNQDLIVDFVFARMTPSERVNALKAGQLDSRIQCPKDATGCNLEVIRSSLITRYSKEAKIQDSLKKIGGIAQDINTALKIANDLGIDVPEEVGIAVNVATAGINALLSFSTGNYIGAISSITSLFGSAQDPDADRHYQMMEFLSKNFEFTNRRLDALIDGQERILDALVQVSEQIYALHVGMDSRFHALDFRLDRIDQNLRQLIWKPWLSCNTVANFARFPYDVTGLSYVDPQTLYFKKFRDRVEVLNMDEDSVRSCMRVLNNHLHAIVSPKGWARFGAFVDLETSLLELSLEQVERLERAVDNDRANDYRPLLSKFVETVVKPSSAIVQRWAEREGIDDKTLLYLLAGAPQTIKDLDEMLKIVFHDDTDTERWNFQCNSKEEPRYSLIGGAICRTVDIETLVNAHLTSALNTKALIEVSEWAVISGQILDLFDGASDSFARSFTEVEAIVAGGAGQRIIRTLMPLMNLGVAYENRLHGGLTAWIIAQNIRQGTTDGNHQKILTANPYLAENVAMILLREFRGDQVGKPLAKATGVSLENRHSQALLHARSENAFPLGPFHALYGDNKVFKLDENGRPTMLLDINESQIALPLPGPKQLREGRFVLPVVYDDLLNARGRVAERVIDYDMGNDADLIQTLAAIR